MIKVTSARLALTAGLIAAGVALVAFTQPPAKDNKPAAGAPPEMQLPPGWTPEDMKAYEVAGTPGKMHEWLAKQAGDWNGKSQMWMAPGTPPMASECKQTVKTIMEGRYIEAEMSGDMPGMGAFLGRGIVGYDNVAQKFVGTWFDNHSTGIMQGVGELSKDAKTMTWTYTFHCPILKKQTTMRQVETYTSENAMRYEMFCTDPKSGKEYKCMMIDMTKKS